MRTGLKKTAFLYISTAICMASVPVISANSYDSASENATAVSFNNNLVDAAEFGDNIRLKSLLQGGQDANQRGEFESTALLRAAYQGNASAVKLLLEHGANPNLSDLGGATPLHFAVRNSNAEIIDLLLKNGADVNLADSEGYTPLMRASINGDTKTLEKLIASGADTKMQNEFGETAVEQAAEGQNKELVFAILANEPAKKAAAPEKSDATAVQTAKVDVKALGNLATASGKETEKKLDPKLVEVPTKPAATPAPVKTAEVKTETAPAKTAETKTKTETAPTKQTEAKLAETKTTTTKATTNPLVKAEEKPTTTAKTEETGIENFFTSLFSDEPTTPAKPDAAPAQTAAKTEETKTQTAKATIAPKTDAAKTETAKQEEPKKDITDSILTALFGPSDEELTANQNKANTATKTADNTTAKTQAKTETKPAANKDEKISFHTTDAVAVPAEKVEAQKIDPRISFRKAAEQEIKTPETKTQAVAKQEKPQELAKVEPSTGNKIPEAPKVDAATQVAKVQEQAPAPLKLTETQKIYMLNFGSFASEGEAKAKLVDIKQKAPEISKDINFKLVQKTAMGQKLFYLNAGQFTKKEDAVAKCRTYISSGVNCRPQETKILYSEEEKQAPAKPEKLASSNLPALAPASGSKKPTTSSDELFNELAELEEAEKKRLQKPKPLQYKDLSPAPSSAELEIPKVTVPTPAPKAVVAELPKITAQAPTTASITSPEVNTNNPVTEQATIQPVQANIPSFTAAKAELPTIVVPQAANVQVTAPQAEQPKITLTEIPQEQKIVANINSQPVELKKAPTSVTVSSRKDSEQTQSPLVQATSPNFSYPSAPVQQIEQAQAAKAPLVQAAPIAEPAPQATQARIKINPTIPGLPTGATAQAFSQPQVQVQAIAPQAVPASVPVYTVPTQVLVTQRQGQSVSNLQYEQTQQPAQIATAPLQAPVQTYAASPEANAYFANKPSFTVAPANNGAKMWVSAKYFTNQNAARGFWNQIKMQSSGNYDSLRMRTKRGISRDSVVSAEIGPVYSSGDAQKLCSQISAGGVSCEIMGGQSSSRYNDLQAASGYNVAGEEINGGSWAVQLGTYSTRDSAVNAWNNLKNSHAILNSLDFKVDESGNQTKLRAGNFGNAAAAENICENLRKNYVSCITVRG